MDEPWPLIPRIYLTGSLAIEHGEQLIRERQFPGRQGRIAFVFLAVNRHRSIHRDELLGAIWPDDAPAQTDSGLDAILSKLRSMLKSAGFAAADAGVTVTFGNHRAAVAGQRLDRSRSRGATRSMKPKARCGATTPLTAWSLANVAVVISRRPFLADVEAPWIESQRAALRTHADARAAVSRQRQRE